MKRFGVLFGVAMVVVALVMFFQISTAAQGLSDSRPEGVAGDEQWALGLNGSDSDPVGEPAVYIPEQYRPRPADDGGSAAVADVAATVYFTPQDENTSVTVLFLYNTSGVTATVGLETYRLNGSVYISTEVAVPPAGLVRICADSVSTISATWQDVVLVNMTTFSTYAKMTLPPGVKAEGYVVWNDSSTYDPLQIAPTLPLRFSSDPATVFVPTVQRN